MSEDQNFCFVLMALFSVETVVIKKKKRFSLIHLKVLVIIAAFAHIDSAYLKPFV